MVRTAPKPKPAAKKAPAKPVEPPAPGPRVRNLGVRRVRVADLQDAPWNFRTHPQAQEASLAGAVEELGFYGYPDVYDAGGGLLCLVDGHLRKELLLKHYGAETEIEVNVTDFDEAEAKKATLTKDPLAAMAESDAAKLDALLREVNTGSEALSAMLADLAKDAGLYATPEVHEDEVPEPPKVPVTKPGDLWLLGPHRLLCGDSTKAEDVGRLMGGEKAGLCFTSPPYNVGKLGWSDKAKYDTDADDKSREGFLGFLNATTRLAMSVAEWLVINIQQVAGNKVAVLEWLHEWREHFADMAIWNKETAEPAMEPGVLNSQFEYLVVLSAKKNPTRKLPSTWRGSVSNVHSGGKRVGNEAASIHRATFPLHVPAWGLRTFDEARLVYEPFSGSGTTIIAAQQLDRRCFAIEISPAYVDVAIERFERLTGEKAKRA